MVGGDRAQQPLPCPDAPAMQLSQLGVAAGDDFEGTIEDKVLLTEVRRTAPATVCKRECMLFDLTATRSRCCTEHRRS
jgi:hypothetical protein